jgi:hypothetical protein
MFGFCVFPIPLGRRLCLVALILFLTLFYEPPAWLLYVQRPFEYATPLLAVLGQILFLSLCLDWVFFILAGVVQDRLRHAAQRDRSRVFVGIEQYVDPIGPVLPVFGILLFGLAVSIAPRVHFPWWAAFAGWIACFLFLVLESIRDPSFTTYQVAELQAREDSELVFISLQTGRDIITTSFQADWQGATGYLIANGWEPVDLRQVDRRRQGRTCWERTARFRRAQQQLPFFSMWRGRVEAYRLGV